MKSDDVVAAVDTIVSGNLAKIGQILQLTGGWEAWLQVEATLQLLSALGEGASASREKNYPAPDNAKRADIYLKPARGVDIYVELKVQNAPNDDILNRFLADAAKIKGLNDSTKANIIVAVGFVHAAQGADLKAMPAKVTPSSALKIQQWDANNRQWVDATAAPKDNLRTLLIYKLA